MASVFMENFCSAGLDIELVKLHLLSYGCKGSELKKWINLCNIFYIMGERGIQGLVGET